MGIFPFRVINDRAEADKLPIWDSRSNPAGRGIGFPSACQDLVLIPPNLNDPAGYYAELDVVPWATMAEIKSAVRRWQFHYHPDTGANPDPDKLERITLIGQVLLDPDSRWKYNNTPPGYRLMDAVRMAEMSKMPDVAGMDEEEFNEVFRPQSAPKRGRSPVHQPGARYDFFAIGLRNGDWMLANQWYHHLIITAPRTGYRTVIKVCLCDHDEPSYDAAELTFQIPRHWTPSDANAYALFVKVAGVSAMTPGLLPTPTLKWDRYF